MQAGAELVEVIRPHILYRVTCVTRVTACPDGWCGVVYMVLCRSVRKVMFLGSALLDVSLKGDQRLPSYRGPFTGTGLLTVGEVAADACTPSDSDSVRHNAEGR
jgi:hypothetical protein